ncbi:tyrosine-type recombinase/integrase [Mesorhizobium sp.]|uniref:tyrosine-type recombinase/integrase n=1 Tax=Mesorhizobium sp. TaxID=1871066 RepID=UPI00257B0005|nr:tyrosine-type recombinase/integrase [Mesorhizobium sp.]
MRRFQVGQQDYGVPLPTMNSIVSGAALLLHPHGRPPDLARRLVRLSHPRKLPVVLTRDEVARPLNATTCLKHQAALSVAYGAGLRVAEVSTLKVTDVDSERMLLLRIERGKGGRYRNAMLSTDLLAKHRFACGPILNQGPADWFGVVRARQNAVDAQAACAVGIARLEFNRATQEVCSNLARCGQLKRLRKIAQVALSELGLGESLVGIIR